MLKVLFLIHDLSHGGAEKVLVNLVNNMDPTKFDITVAALFGGGVNEQFLDMTKVRYIVFHKKAFPGNSHVMKLFSPQWLYRHYIKEKYDIVVSYLEGPAARIVSGCEDQNTKLVSWVHCTMHSAREIAASFRSAAEAKRAYEKYHKLVFVSEGVKQAFLQAMPLEDKGCVLYNVNESDKILALSAEAVEEGVFSSEEIKLIGVGKVVENKGFDRLARIHKRLKEEGFPVHTYILGKGAQQEELERYAAENAIADSFTFLGYQTNPYKYVANCDLFVCASHAEGFSTAATEALIVGTPVCTVKVSGMEEMLGKDNAYGIVTENDEEALYQGIKQLLQQPQLLSHYKKQAQIRGRDFSTQETVKAVEQMLMEL